jgi:hypothetical protein
MFWRKPKEIVFATTESSAIEYARPDFVKKETPRWFKDIKPVGRNPLEVANQAKNVRTCAGLQDLFARAISIPAPEDIAFRLENQDGEVQAQWENTAGMTSIDYHPEEQRGSFENQAVHLKVVLPWQAKANFDVFETRPEYSDIQRHNMRVAAGIIDYSIVPAVNVNYFIDHPAPGEAHNHLIKFGESMAWMVPMTDQKVKIHYELLSEEEMRRFRGRMFYATSTHIAY